MGHRLSPAVVALTAQALAFGCGRGPARATAGNGAGTYGAAGAPDAGADASTESGAGAAATGDSGAAGLELLGAPLTFAPTDHGFGLNAVLRSGAPSALSARVRDEAASSWTPLGPPSSPAADVAQWAVDGLQPGRRYVYEIRAAADGGDAMLYSGSAVTARPPGSAFTFDVLTDSHIAPRDPVPLGTDVGTDVYGSEEGTLLDVAQDLAADVPDFLIHMGDMLDFHMFGFNAPPPDGSWTRLGYLNYRRLLGDTLGHASHFPGIGNWDGENGCDTQEEIDRSRGQRLLYVPGPSPDTYPQGGSPYEDYYAFTWGDALFVVLNVMTYTPTCHLLTLDAGLPDDWTLGQTQLAWLRTTLAGATSKWRFLFIHHTVGGAAGDPADSAYGRGGGQAAHVGEQATIHQMMLAYGVQVFFYGHDHVFTDMTVDGIHYTLPGSAGAPWKFPASQTGYAQSWPDSGHGRVRVSPDAVHVDFVSVGGAVLASYTLP